MHVSIYNVFPKSWPMTYFPWLLTQKRLRFIGALWPTLWKFSIFRHCRASHTKATEPRPAKFCQILEGLRGLPSTVKSWKNSSPKNFAPSLSWKFWTTRFRHFFIRHRIYPDRNVASTNQSASVNLQCVPYKLNYFPWLIIVNCAVCQQFNKRTLLLLLPRSTQPGHPVVARLIHDALHSPVSVVWQHKLVSSWGLQYGDQRRPMGSVDSVRNLRKYFLWQQPIWRIL